MIFFFERKNGINLLAGGWLLIKISFFWGKTGIKSQYMYLYIVGSNWDLKKRKKSFSNVHGVHLSRHIRLQQIFSPFCLIFLYRVLYAPIFPVMKLNSVFQSCNNSPSSDLFDNILIHILMYHN